MDGKYSRIKGFELSKVKAGTESFVDAQGLADMTVIAVEATNRLNKGEDFNTVMVDYYGCPTPINQMAAISVPEARILAIQPWDGSALSLIEKAILASDIGINPSNDGHTIRLVFPALTEERRKQLSKDVSKFAEDTKVAVRQIRRDCIEKIKTMKKNSEITEDDQKHGEEKLQKITDEFVKKIDEIAAAKTKEIMEI